MAGQVGSTVAPGGVTVDTATEVREGVWGLRLGLGMDEPTVAHDSASLPIWLYGAPGGFAITRWLVLELDAHLRSTPGGNATAADPGTGDFERNATAAQPTRADAAMIAERTVDTAARLTGTRYRWGGDSPGYGFDCSGFVRYVYAQQGIQLPRVSSAQARAGRRLPTRLGGLQPGDLLFFARRGRAVDHVAMYAGNGRIIHASRRGYGVRYDELSGAGGRWYAQHLVAVRRVIEDEGTLETRRADDTNVGELPLGQPAEAAHAERVDPGAPAPQL